MSLEKRRDVPYGIRIESVRQFPFCFGPINVSDAGSIDNDIRSSSADDGFDHLGVAHVQGYKLRAGALETSAGYFDALLALADAKQFLAHKSACSDNQHSFSVRIPLWGCLRVHYGPW